MRHSEKAMFDKDIIKRKCEETGRDYSEFEEWCEKLDGKIGTYNRWLALVHDTECYIFQVDGKAENVPAELVREL